MQFILFAINVSLIQRSIQFNYLNYEIVIRLSSVLEIPDNQGYFVRFRDSFVDIFHIPPKTSKYFC